MTESEIPVLVPEGKDATDLTMGELDIASYHMKADVLECIAGNGNVKAKRYGAFVELAIIWAKRGGATESRDVLLKRFRDYEPNDMFHALRMDEAAAGVGDVDPTSSSDESSAPSSLEHSGGSPESSTDSTA